MKNILIIRPSAIGDIVMASAMIPALKVRYPDSRLVWLADPSVASLLETHPQIDEILLWPKAVWREDFRKGRWLRLAASILSLRKKLRAGNFDLAIDAVGLLRSRLLARLSGAGQRIGFVSREPGEFLMTRIVTRGGRIELMSSEYRHLMEELGCDTRDFAPSLELASQDRRKAEALLHDQAMGPFVAIAPFTTRPQKHWFEERWVELAERIWKQTGLRPLLLGGPGDVRAAGRIASRCKAPLVNLTGKCGLRQTAALVSLCDLLIGVDTGLTHMGTAFSRPTLALFGSTCPYLETPSPRTRVLYEPLPCSPCKRRPSCSGDFTCMASLSVDRVMAEVQALLASGGRE